MDAANRVLQTAELISTIFSFLKEERDKWKAPVARLAMVNHPFFHAAVGVVWEHMDSFEPFCSLLLPETFEDDLRASVTSSAFTEDSWKRFDLYSSKTRTLALNEPASLSSNPCWAFYMGTSNPQPRTLFPSLKGLFLNSADPLSLFIAFAVCPHVKTLGIHLRPSSTTQESKDAISALTLSLARRACLISNVHLFYPFQRQTLGNILAMKTVKYLQVALLRTEHDAIDPTFWSPPVLMVSEASTTLELDAAYPITRDRSVRKWIQFDGAFADLRKLMVRGTSLFHEMLTSHPCWPSPSQRFNTILLGVRTSSSPNAEPLTPVTMAEYIVRNPNPARFCVRNVNPKAYVHPSALDRFRSSPSFRNTDLLLAQLAASKNLTYVHFDGVHFPPGDVVLQVLHVLPNLPNLLSFRFLPAPISTSEQDALASPSLSCLKDISRHCPKLVHLAIQVDLFDTALTFPNTIRIGASKMQTLYLAPSSQGLPQYTVRQSLGVATYLYLLFPDLFPLASSCKEGDTAEQSFWDDIDDVISTMKIIRRADAVESSGS